MNRIEFLNRVCVELIEKANYDVIEEVFSEEYIAHADGKDYKGHNFIKRWNKEFHASLSNVKIKSIHILNESEDKITWLRVLSAKHTKTLRRIPASEKRITWEELVVTRFEGNKIAEDWLVSQLAEKLLLKGPKSGVRGPNS